MTKNEAPIQIGLNIHLSFPLILFTTSCGRRHTEPKVSVTLTLHQLFKAYVIHLINSISVIVFYFMQVLNDICNKIFILRIVLKLSKHHVKWITHPSSTLNFVDTGSNFFIVNNYSFSMRLQT